MTKNSIAIIGGGPAGVMCAVHAAKNPENLVYIVEQKDLLDTILPTGGGRCNIAHYETNIKQLASNYPRGEKFLLSPLSRFSTNDTMSFFKEIGLSLKVLEDNKIFPCTESSKDVQRVLSNYVKTFSNIKVVKGRVFQVKMQGNKYFTDYYTNHLLTDALVFATGSNPSGYRLIASIGQLLVNAKPSLCPLTIRERQFNSLPGVSVQNVSIKVNWQGKTIYKVTDDLLFTHTALSGPAILEISSICAALDFNGEQPLKLEVNFVNQDTEKFRNILRKEFDKNPKKNVINVCTKFLSRYLAALLLEESEFDQEMNAAEVSKIKFNDLVKNITSYTFNVTGREEQTAKVMAGGVDLKDVDNKTMQSKKYLNLFFCGEVLDIDGLCGGFNLQNCWTTGYIAGKTLAEKAF